MTIRANSAALLSALLDSGLTVTAAARQCAINRDVFKSLLEADRPVTVKTAGKLKRHFGDKVISIAHPAQILKG